MAALNDPAAELAVAYVAVLAAHRLKAGPWSRHSVGRRRTPWISWPRQVAAWVARDLTGASYPAIGRAFGLNHPSVLYACRRAPLLLARSAWLRDFHVRLLLDVMGAR